MTTKKVLVFPGAFQYVKNYGGLEGADIWIKGNNHKNGIKPDFIIGHSAGGVFALTEYKDPEIKFILINPPVPKRGVVVLVWRWVRFLIFEGIPYSNVVGPTSWGHSVKLLYRLVKIDVLEIIKIIPKGNVVIVRGKKDDFYCTEESAKLLKENNIEVVEVDAGHDWNNQIAETVNSILTAGLT